MNEKENFSVIACLQGAATAGSSAGNWQYI
jgi:hypothetical protein